MVVSLFLNNYFKPASDNQHQLKKIIGTHAVSHFSVSAARQMCSCFQAANLVIQLSRSLEIQSLCFSSMHVVLSVLCATQSILASQRQFESQDIFREIHITMCSYIVSEGLNLRGNKVHQDCLISAIYV